MKSIAKMILLVAVVHTTALAAPAFAPTGGQVFEFPAGGFTEGGYTFTTTGVAEEVTALGLYDTGAHPFDQAHTVSLWDASGTLLASATIDSTDPLQGLFAYANLSAPIMILPGTYTIGAEYQGGDGTDSFLGQASVNPAGDFSFGTAVSGPANTFPTGEFGGAFDAGFFGPNLLATPAPEMTRTGAFSSIALMAGMVCLYDYRRRRSA